MRSPFDGVAPTAEESARPLPGDEIVASPDVVMDRAFSVPGSPDDVWPWVVQLGKNRAGWYLPRSVERVVPPRRRGLRTIDPALQDLQVGRRVDDWGPGGWLEAAAIRPPDALVYRSTRGRTDLSWTISLRPQAEGTRVHLRLRLGPVRRARVAETGGGLLDALSVAGLAAGLRERLVDATNASPSATRLEAELGAVQQTLFIPLVGRANESRKERPILHDPKAVEMVDAIGFSTAKYGAGAGGSITVVRTAIVDHWVRRFLAGHPTATVVEIGAGLNTRFERVDNGRCHWVDLDLPDTMELRRRFFDDTDRRHSIAASVLDVDWHDTVDALPSPYFFVAEGVLVYLERADMQRAVGGIVDRFPLAPFAIDTYPQKLLERQHSAAAQRDIEARWAWSCDDPRTLEPLGLRLVETYEVAAPPRTLTRTWPLGTRLGLAALRTATRGLFDVTLFETRAAAGGAPRPPRQGRAS